MSRYPVFYYIVSDFFGVVEEELMAGVGDPGKTCIFVFLGDSLGAFGVHPINVAKVEFYFVLEVNPLDNTLYCVLGFQRPLENKIESSFAADLFFAEFPEVAFPCLVFLLFHLHSNAHDLV